MADRGGEDFTPVPMAPGPEDEIVRAIVGIAGERAPPSRVRRYLDLEFRTCLRTEQ